MNIENENHTTTTETVRPWYKKKRFIIPAILVALFVIIGVTSDSEEPEGSAVAAVESTTTAVEETTTTEAPTTTAAPTTTTEAPTTTTAPPPAEGTYGSDPTLDALQDRCAGGDSGACDDLYWDSPLGSEYESFGREHGGSAPDSNSADISGLAMQMAWDGMSPSVREDACLGYNLYGPEEMFVFFDEGAGGVFTYEEFKDFFDGACA